MAEGLVLKSEEEMYMIYQRNWVQTLTDWEYIQHTDGKTSPIRTLNTHHLSLK